jgi:hypothetical protein
MAATKLTGQVPDANAPSGSVIQVVQVASTVDVTTGGSTTVITASITPSSTSNKILTMFNGDINIVPSSNAYGYFSLERSGSSLGGFRSAGVQLNQNLTIGTGGNFLDSPATTSSITYTLTVARGSGGTSSVTALTGTTIILMEIAA